MAGLEKIGVQAVVEGLNKFNSGVTQMNTGIKGLGDKIVANSAKFKTAGIAVSAFAAAGVLAIKSFTSAALEQERAVKTLAATIENTGEIWADHAEKVMAATAALQAKTNFGDEEQIRILSKMIPILGDVDKALAALPAVLDAATASGMDASSVANTLTRALAGQVNQARSVGIEFEADATFGERLALVLGKVGGAAEANADPWIQLNNVLGDFKETLGESILPLVRPTLQFFANMLKEMQKLPKPVFTVIGVVLTFGTAIAGLAGPILLLIGFLPQIVAGLALVKVAMLALTLSTGPIGLIIIGITALVVAGWLLHNNWDAVWSGIKNITQRVFDFISSAYDSNFGWLLPGGPLIKAIIAIPEIWEKTWQSVVDMFSNFIEFMSNLVQKFKDLINDIVLEQKRVSQGFRIALPAVARVTAFTDAMVKLFEILDKINSLQSGDMLSFPKFQHGGRMTKSGMALVGERGPELVHLPAGANVIPNGSTTNYNVTANYSSPQEPQSLALDLQAIAMMARS